jgi:DNA-binding beta-propeller fold protein YncE
MIRYMSILFAAILLGTTVAAQMKSSLQLLHTFHIASAGGWDYLETCPINDWLYISHGKRVNILNKTNGDSVGIIENTSGVHGIAFDVANGKGYTSNGALNNVFAFEIHTNKVLATIATGQNPDAIMYEPFSKKIITCNGRSNNLTIIDPLQNIALDSVPLGGKPETAVSDSAGKIFVNIEDKNEIIVIDATTLKILHHWPISPGEGPTGLAYDSKTKRLFAGCEKQLIVVNATNGKIVQKIPIGDGCDGVVFDANTNTIYTSNGEGTVTVIDEVTANTFLIRETFISKKGARTITIDKTTGLLYLPTADFEPMTPGEKGWPKMKEGSFQILVLGK